MDIIIFILSLLFTMIIIPPIRNMLLSSNITGENYKGHTIPVGMGIAFIPVVIINAVILNYFFRDNPDAQLSLLIFLVGIMTVATAGLIDDLAGSRETLGFKGHIRSLLKGKLTTGGLKAVVGGFISLLVGSFFSYNIIEILVNALIIALFTNLINLLDLRPGRAIKGFLLVSVLFIFTGLSGEVKTMLISFIAYAIAYLPQDIKAKSMMGDVGSNALGIILGIVTVVSYAIVIKYIILGLLILIHIITEKYSLTKIIEKNPVLDYFDKLGR
ncbi:MAG: glycosyltransferase [Natronincolaceae bacterium]|nr:glycosyltransferase [Bacillota bacterium]NLK90844.1 glycosyltransferase [Clostridiales bacterium]